MLKEVLASDAAKLVAACVCPVVGASVVTLKVPQVRESVHKATTAKPKREARAKPRVRTPKNEAAAKKDEEKPVETALLCGDPELLRSDPLAPSATSLISVPPPRMEMPPPPERIFVTHNCGPAQFATGIPGLRIAGVPEPATWAQMIAGFALMGATIRAGRRRRDGHIRVTRAA